MSISAGSGEGWDFVVDRRDLRCRAVHDAPPISDVVVGEVLIRVDAFALTANNLTYAATGDRFGYWSLFPASDGWGRIPAWGVGTVVLSGCPDVEVGERFAGMVPMSTHFVALPRSTRQGIVDLAAHRAQANPVYNRYTRVTGGSDDDLQRDSALRPAYILSFVLAHHLRASNWLGATRLLVTSASSKASLGLAHALASADVPVVGLTSPHHRALVHATGLYDDVAIYDRISELPTASRSVLIDVTGNPAIRDAVRSHLGASLVETVHVGQTDWDQPEDRLLGAADGAAAFFAPTTIQQLVDEWGPAEFATRLDTDLNAFITRSSAWLTPDLRDGRADMAGAFDDVAAGRVPPDRYVIVRPQTPDHQV